MKKTYLMTPGPTEVPQEILDELSRPIIHHRTEEFKKIVAKVHEGLKYVFQTKNPVVTFTASGTGAMEAAISNFLAKKDKVLVVKAGKFGERWAEICEAYGISYKSIDVEWGRAVDPKEIEKALEKEKFSGFLIQACETSTGVWHPIDKISQILQKFPNTLFVVDAISALGGINIPMDEWEIDVLIGATQKTFNLPPGLGFIGISKKAQERLEKSDLPKYYFDVAKELKNLEKNTNAYTPAVSLYYGLAKSLELIKQEGLENVFKRHKNLAKLMREAVTKLGLELFCPDSSADTLTTIKLPSNLDAKKFLTDIESKFNIKFAGGQGALAGKIVRIAHMGRFTKLDVDNAIEATKKILESYNFD